VYKSSCEVSVIRFQILMKLEFPRETFDTYSSNFMEIRSVGNRVVSCGRTDMTKLIVAFRSLVNAPENSIATSQKTLLLQVLCAAVDNNHISFSESYEICRCGL
jgi:hypothetical protein